MAAEVTLIDKQTVANSNQITWVIEFNKLMCRTLRSEHDLTVAQYRILALLSNPSTSWRAASLVDRLNLTPSMISISLKPLYENDLVKTILEQDDSASRTIDITERGLSILHEADLSIAFAQDEYFGVLSPELRSIIATGAAMTNQSRELAMRLEGDRPLEAYSILEGYLISEQCHMRSSRKCGLSVSDARILLYAFESYQRIDRDNSLTPAALMHGLLLSRATVSEHLAKLRERELVCFETDRLDKRSFVVSLTAKGRQRCLEFVDAVYREIAQDLRPSSGDERRRYSDAAAAVVSHLRAHR